MSFIYDNKNLLSDLFKAAEHFDKITKKAQDVDVKDLANKLFQNIKNELSPSFTSSTGAGPNYASLTSFDSLVKYLDKNDVKFADNFLVLPKNTPPTNLQDYVKYPDPPDVNEENFNYYVNKGGIAAYVKDLQKNVSNNPALSNLVSGLTQSFNNLLDDNEKISDKPEKPEVKNVSLKDNKLTDQKQQQDKKEEPKEESREKSDRVRSEKSQTQNLDEILKFLPLLPDRIDFERMIAFVEKYRSLVPSERRAPSASVIESIIGNIRARFRIQSGQSLSANPRSIVNTLPGTEPPTEYINLLRQLVSNTEVVLNSIKSQFQFSDISDNLKRALNDQVGASELDVNSFAARNMEKLNSLANEIRRLMPGLK